MASFLDQSARVLRSIFEKNQLDTSSNAEIEVVQTASVPQLLHALPETALASVGLSHDSVTSFLSGERCAFWFVRASALREYEGTLPRMRALRMQTLRKDRPDWLVQKEICFRKGCQGAYLRDYLIVSHRWEAQDDPDGAGKQIEAICLHLRSHTWYQYVWIGVLPEP